MCKATLGDLVDFVWRYAGHKAFQGYDSVTIANELNYAIEGSRLLYVTSPEGKITGTVFWTQTGLKTIHISQLIADSSQARNSLLCELYALFGTQFKVTYYRGRRLVEVPDNRKFLQKALKVQKNSR